MKRNHTLFAQFILFVFLTLSFTHSSNAQFISRPSFKELNNKIEIDYFIFDTRPGETFDIKFTFFDNMNNDLKALSLHGDYPKVISTEESAFQGRVVWDVLKDRQEMPSIDYIQAEITSKLEPRGITFYISPKDKIQVSFSDVNSWADCNLNGVSVLSCGGDLYNKGAADLILPSLNYGLNKMLITASAKFSFSYNLNLSKNNTILYTTTEKFQITKNEYTASYRFDIIVTDKNTDSFIDYSKLAFYELLQNGQNFDYPFRKMYAPLEDSDIKYGFQQNEIVGRDFIWNGTFFKAKELYKWENKIYKLWAESQYVISGKTIKRHIPLYNEHKVGESRIIQTNNNWHGKITKYTDTRYAQWKTKGEYEKTIDYESRTSAQNTQSKLEIIKIEALEFYKTIYRASFSTPESFSLLEYDADNECYKVSSDGIMNDFLLSVPINYAKTFKVGFDAMRILDIDFELIDDKMNVCRVVFSDSKNNIFHYERP